MSNLLIYRKESGKTKLYKEADVYSEWLTGTDLYELVPNGVLYPIISDRVEWNDPLTDADQIAFAKPRSFFWEPA